MSWWRLRRAAVFSLALAVFAFPAAAQEGSGCAAFKWDVGKEAALLNAPDLASVPSGAAREVSAEAFRLVLTQAADAGLPTPPERTPKNPSSRAGFVRFEAPAAGIYQATLSAAGWVDLVQNGKYLKPAAFSGARDCPGVRKIVRFELVAGPFVLQISDAAEEKIGVVVAPADGG